MEELRGHASRRVEKVGRVVISSKGESALCLRHEAILVVHFKGRHARGLRNVGGAGKMIRPGSTMYKP